MTAKVPALTIIILTFNWSGVLLLSRRAARSRAPCLYQEVTANARPQNQARSKAIEGG